MHVPAQSAEKEEERRQRLLKPGIIVEWISQPLPAEVQPPHLDLGEEWHLPVSQRGLLVLPTIEVVHEAIVGRLAERAARPNLCGAAGWLAFVDRREACCAKWLGKKRRHAEQQRAGTSEEKLRSDKCSRPANRHGSCNCRQRKKTRHVVGVTESAQIRDHHEQSISSGPIGVVAPADDQPRNEGQSKQ